MIIGLTGKSCSGKDSVASILGNRGFVIIDVDALGHDALESCKYKISSVFGSSVIGSDGRVDRKKLGGIVFSDPSALESLNRITHPMMAEKALGMAMDAEMKGLVPVINAALLESMGFVPYCTSIILLKASYDIRSSRAMERNGTTEEEFRKRDAAQEKIGEGLEGLGNVTVISNEGTEEELEKKVLGFIKKQVL